MKGTKKGEVVTVVLYLTRHATMDLDKVVKHLKELRAASESEQIRELGAASESELSSDTDTQSCHNYGHS